MQEIIDQLAKLAKDKQKENKKYFAKLKKKPPKNLDRVMQDLHTKEFQKTDCLECANCCKTTSPLFTDIDVDRISKHLKMGAHQFEEKYLKKDEDGDFVLQESPCSFLASDNYCLIYDVRPKGCREYPHTDRKRFHQISEITMQNLTICPAAYNIVEKLKTTIPLEHKSNKRGYQS